MVYRSCLRLAEAVIKEASTSLEPTQLKFPPLPSPRELLKLYKIQAQRNLSQNFLLDSRINNKIVTKTGNIKNCYVCEVGPGPGNITRAIILNGAKSVVVIEKDRRFLPSLEVFNPFYVFYLYFPVVKVNESLMFYYIHRQVKNNCS